MEDTSYGARQISAEEEAVNPDSLPRYVDERTAAAITGFALATLRNHRSLRKGIPYRKVGRTVRYLVADVIAFMEAGKIATEKSAPVPLRGQPPGREREVGDDRPAE